MDTFAVFPVLEIGHNDPVPDVHLHAVGDDAFKSVTYFEPVFPLLFRYQDQQTVVLVFFAYAGLFEQFHRIHFLGFTFQRFHGNNSNLHCCLPFYFSCKLCYLCLIGRIYHIGAVCDKTGKLRVINRCRCGGAENQDDQYQ